MSNPMSVVPAASGHRSKHAVVTCAIGSDNGGWGLGVVCTPSCEFVMHVQLVTKTWSYGPTLLHKADTEMKLEKRCAELARKREPCRRVRSACERTSDPPVDP